ncbi:MAG TPA: T9SS type A sorting domain-containing protein [Bacteroidia bacterium]|nr:T9SS type A sorting domain-containing protein [Bacteroidia bacterium]
MISQTTAVRSIHTRIRIFSVLGCIFLGTTLSAQQFINGGLESVVFGPNFNCKGWQNVPFDDPVCLADVLGRDSPDMTSHDEPDADYGICGDPHSGKSFVSGTRSINPGDDFQEGIMQEVDDLVQGAEYGITFWQAVVKQRNLLDKSGSWAVYIDSALAGVAKFSHSNLPYNATNLDWDERTINFIATKESHWIKFLPVDDDSIEYSFDDEDAGLRMGIDDISLSPVSKLNVSFTNGPLAGIILVNNKCGKELSLEVFSSNGDSVMTISQVGKNETGVDLTSLPAGNYFLVFSNGKEFYRKEYDR